VYFHVFRGTKNLIFDSIWTQSSQNIDLYHFGKVFKIRIQKKYRQKKSRKNARDANFQKKKYAPTKVRKENYSFL
jgi:hypothetical protein